jgi:biopolymer transport protein ExbD
MARKQQENPALDMTPMIDVVFELIIFFVVTIKQEDLFTRLNANRPAPSTGSASESNDITVTIEVGRGVNANGALVYNKRPIQRPELDRNLKEVAKTSQKTPIIVRCAEDSPHKALVDVLDICYRHGLHSVSIFTM